MRLSEIEMMSGWISQLLPPREITAVVSGQEQPTKRPTEEDKLEDLVIQAILALETGDFKTVQQTCQVLLNTTGSSLHIHAIARILLGKVEILPTGERHGNLNRAKESLRVLDRGEVSVKLKNDIESLERDIDGLIKALELVDSLESGFIIN